MGNENRVVWENEQFTGEELDGSEQKLLMDQVMGVLGYGNQLLTQLFKDNERNILAAASVAKASFKSPFRGLSAGDSEFAVQLIRPQHVRRSTAATEATAATWSFTFASGADYWLGFGTDNTTALNIDKRLLVLPLAVAWTSGTAPVVEELLWQQGSVIYPVMVIRHGWMTDVNGVRFARIRPMILKPKSTTLVQNFSIAAGVDELVLIGLSFVMGDLARTQNPTAIQT